MWSMNGMIHTCTYHVDYKTIFCRFLTCDPWMAWYIPVLIMLTKYRYVSCHSWITCQEPTEDCLLVNMISTGMYHAIHWSHVSGTGRRLFYSQHDKYMYVSCHSWITCQEPTEDCLIVNMISTCIKQSSAGSWDMRSMNGMIHTCTYHVD
jgi:hypothetical protein